jgi:hypothetical protein
MTTDPTRWQITFPDRQGNDTAEIVAALALTFIPRKYVPEKVTGQPVVRFTATEVDAHRVRDLFFGKLPAVERDAALSVAPSKPAAVRPSLVRVGRGRASHVLNRAGTSTVCGRTANLTPIDSPVRDEPSCDRCSGRVVALGPMRRACWR